MELSKFFSIRKSGSNQFFPAAGGNGKTVMVTSHIYWTDLIGLALLRLGYNVIFASPWYTFWTDDSWWDDFDNQFSMWVNTIRQHKVICVIGGNTTAMVPHKKTGEPLHRAANVPAVHYQWDEPRAIPPMARRGISLQTYFALLKDSRTLNVIWDIDVKEELEKFCGLENTMHSPLATAPELWEAPFVPMQNRPKSACFLGNCHFVTPEMRATFEPELVEWAGKVATRKMANLDQGIVNCVDDPAAMRVDTTDSKSIERDFRRWFIIDAMLMEKQRNMAVKSLAHRLGDSFTLVGGNWEQIGLHAEKTHSGVPGANAYYVSHKASLNLYGGCVHGGMPLRPYEIASSNGLIFTHFNRELPDLYEPGKECVAFRNESEMLEQLDKILTHPADYNRVIGAGRRRTVEQHTWENRMRKVMQTVGERFGIAV
jgi:hypothetical protein